MWVPVDIDQDDPLEGRSTQTSPSVNDEARAEIAQVCALAEDQPRQDANKHEVNHPWKSGRPIVIHPMEMDLERIPKVQAAGGVHPTGSAREDAGVVGLTFSVGLPADMFGTPSCTGLKSSIWRVAKEPLTCITFPWPCTNRDSETLEKAHSKKVGKYDKELLEVYPD
jgi:hypothetical protein